MDKTLAPPTQPLFEASHLSKRYGDTTVVDDVSFAIAPGECLGVIGPNGAGKTTTIRMCLGHTAPDGGTVQFYAGAAADPLQMPRDALAIKAHLGVVTQFDTLDPDFTCAENLRVFGRYFGIKGAVMDERVPRLLEFAALTHKANAKPGELSGGMKRRLSLARALVNDPRLLLLDEPLEGLAPIIVEELLRAIRRITREEGLSAIIVEQHPQAILAISDHAAVLDRGTVVHTGSAAELSAQPELLDRLLGVAR